MKKNRSIDLKYVVVEITLVTIGILIAIEVNNWNSSRLIQIEIDDYLLEIHSEIQSGIKYQEQYINRFESMSSSLIRVMKIIERNDLDSIPYLKNIIWPIGTTWPVSYNLPILEEFIDENKWIHLDIAGPARSDNRKGATGFGVLSLYEFFKTISTDLPEN